MQIQTTMIFLGASLCLATPAFADDFYIDGGVSLLTVDGDDLIDPVIGPDHESLGAHFGVNVTKHFSIEGEAIIGLDSDSSIGQTTFTDLGGDPAQVRRTDRWTETSLSYIVGAYVRGNVPVTSKLTVFGRVGIAQVELDRTSNYRAIVSNSDEEPIATSSSNTFSDVGPALGVGATYALSDKIYVRGDLTRYDLPYGDADNVMIGAGLRF